MKMRIAVSARVPLDRTVFPGGGEKGELGPENSKTRVFISAGAKFRMKKSTSATGSKVFAGNGLRKGADRLRARCPR
jgi:hypothetical protein